MLKIETDNLLISSDFYSVQGEGISTGVPSYFVRLSLCNLSCGISRKMMREIKEAGPDGLEDGEIFIGDLHAEGKATWTCDSTSQWAIRGKNESFDYLISRWKQQKILEKIQTGRIHIIWTGGEPTMDKHQQSINNFTTWAIKNEYFPGYITSKNYWKDGEFKQEEVVVKDGPFYEIETNGTLYIEDELFNHLDQINCSPKLANSGMSEKRRINPDAIKRIKEHNNYQFKFVVSTEDDILEMLRDFVMPFNIPMENVVCMPGLDKQEDYHERTRFVLEMAMKYGFRGLTRLHISAWNQTLNV